jgi:hypothetical protein
LGVGHVAKGLLNDVDFGRRVRDDAGIGGRSSGSAGCEEE